MITSQLKESLWDEGILKCEVVAPIKADNCIIILFYENLHPCGVPPLEILLNTVALAIQGLLTDIKQYTSN